MLARNFSVEGGVTRPWWPFACPRPDQDLEEMKNQAAASDKHWGAHETPFFEKKVQRVSLFRATNDSPEAVPDQRRLQR